MIRELKTIDVSQTSGALRIAEEVHATNAPRVLRRDSEELAAGFRPIGSEVLFLK